MSWELRAKKIFDNYKPIQALTEKIQKLQQKRAFHRKQFRKLSQEIPKISREREAKLTEFGKTMYRK